MGDFNKFSIEAILELGANGFEFVVNDGKIVEVNYGGQKSDR